MWSISPILRPDGEIIGASKIARDITERNRMVEDLRASGDRFQSIFAAVSEGIFLSSLAGVFKEVNETGCIMFGYTPEELIGGDIQMISSGVPPYTQHDAIGWNEKAIATGRPQRFDWHRDPDPARALEAIDSRIELCVFCQSGGPWHRSTPIGAGAALHGVEDSLGATLGANPNAETSHFGQCFDHLLVQSVSPGNAFKRISALSFM